MKRVEIAREVIAGYWGSGDKRIAALKKAGYNPDTVQGDVNTLLCCRENIINNIKAMAVKIADNNNWWYVYYSEKYGHECAICHPHGGENHGWQCMGFVGACWHHGGLPTPCNCAFFDNGTSEDILAAKTDAEALRIAQRELGGFKDIKVIKNGGNVIPKSQIQPGDAMILYNGKSCQHLALDMSQTKLADSTSGGNKADNIRADRNFSNYYQSRIKVLIRYTGNGLCTPPKRTIDQLAYEVIENLWGSGDSRKTALTQAGHNYDAVQKRVNEILNPPKPEPTPTPTPAKEITLVAVDVINGDYGNGDKRVAALKKKGYNPDTIQKEVNRLMTESKKKSIDTLAHEVINGYWRSGKKREKVLKACGCNYDAIQKRVNEILNPPKPEPQPTKKYTGKLPTVKLVKSNAQVIEDTIKWVKWIAADNRFHYGYGEHAHHNGCYFCGTQDMKKGHGIVDPDFTYCCNPFIGAAWAHGGCIPTALRKCQNYSSWDFNKGSGYDASSLFDKLGHPAKSKLKAGDVLCSGGHVALYIGGGKLAEASGGDDNKRNSSGWNNSIRITNLTDGRYNGFDRVYRYNGSVNTSMILRHGEISDRVKDMQEFINWYYDGAFFKECGGADGYYGDNTLKWVKKFQAEKFGAKEADGLVGEKTIAEMAKYAA